MAVVINEFEVAQGEAPKERGSGSGEQSAAQQPPAEEHEIERLVEHQMRRCERIWAH